MPKTKGGSFLTKEVGPLPVWGWGAVALTAVIVLRGKGGGGSSSSPSTTSQDFGTGFDSGYLLGLQGAQLGPQGAAGGGQQQQQPGRVDTPNVPAPSTPAGSPPAQAVAPTVPAAAPPPPPTAPVTPSAHAPIMVPTDIPASGPGTNAPNTPPTNYLVPQGSTNVAPITAGPGETIGVGFHSPDQPAMVPWTSSTGHVWMVPVGSNPTEDPQGLGVHF